MTRPSGWDVLDLDADPTPGDVWTVADLQRRWADIADDAELAEAGVRALSADSVVSEWIGESGDVFRRAVEDFAVPLGRCRSSYRAGADALSSWQATLGEVQAQADRALADGRAARERLDAAHADLTAAATAAAGAASLQQALDSRPSTAPAPDPTQVRQATTAAQNAAAQRSRAQSAVNEASAALEAAKSLARDARDVREQDGRSVARRIDDAAALGVPPTSFWNKLKDTAAKSWDVLVDVAKVVVAVLGIVVLIIGGPLAWVVLAAALIVLADTLWKYSQGRASLTDVAFSLLDCIPGFRGLTTVARLGEVLRGARTSLRELTAALRSGAKAAKGASPAIEGWISSGGHSIPRPRTTDQHVLDQWAEAVYDHWRTDPTFAGDIAKHSELSREEVEAVVQHVFHDRHLLTDYDTGGLILRRYDASPEMTEAFERLRRGDPRESDFLLLRHELAELEYEAAHPGASYAEAHAAANRIADWEHFIESGG